MHARPPTPTPRPSEWKGGESSIRPDGEAPITRPLGTDGEKIRKHVPVRETARSPPPQSRNACVGTREGEEARMETLPEPSAKPPLGDEGRGAESRRRRRRGRQRAISLTAVWSKRREEEGAAHCVGVGRDGCAATGLLIGWLLSLTAVDDPRVRVAPPPGAARKRPESRGVRGREMMVVGVGGSRRFLGRVLLHDEMVPRKRGLAARPR